jgi:Family of unknown function (DUF5343)
MTTDYDTLFAPYAPPGTVIHVLRFFRTREVPERLSDKTLGQIGVKDSVRLMIRRSLEFLGLLAKDGTTTERFRGLRFASDDDYPHVLRDVLTAAYAGIFEVADPATATRLQLGNAFRPYSPASQHDRMITLFLGLCREAGVNVPEPPKQIAPTAKQGVRRPRSPALSRSDDGNGTGGRGPRVEGGVGGDDGGRQGGTLFGVTEADIAKLTDAEFTEVWAALGKVARARGRATLPSAIDGESWTEEGES